MKFKYCLGILFLINILVFGSVAGLAVETTKTLQYDGSYNFFEGKWNHTLIFDIDYFQELSDDIFLEGDLVIRASNKKYARPLVAGPNELYLSAYNIIDNLDLKIGKIVTRWGAADLFSPLDNFNPMPPGISLSKKQDKLGTLGASATYYLSNTTYLQGVLLPRLKTTPYPDQYLKENYMANYGMMFPGQEIDPQQIGITYQSAENMVWGLRLNHSFPSFDAGISYYRGYYMDPFPISLSISSGAGMEINLGYPSKQVIGLEFQGEFPGIEGATLRGDLSYIIPEKWQFQGENILDHPYLQAVIGADYTTGSNLYLNGGFIYGLPFERGKDSSPYLYLNANQEIEDCDIKPTYAGVLSLIDTSMVNVIGLDYQVSENVLASVSYSFLLGDEQSKLGLFKQSESIYFTIEWLF